LTAARKVIGALGVDLVSGHLNSSDMGIGCYPLRLSLQPCCSLQTR